MIPGLLTAGNGQTWESDLVTALDRPGSAMTVVRRCVDMPDVLTCATTGQASVVVLSAELRRLDSEAVQRLQSSGVAIVGIYPAGDDRVRAKLERIGITTVMPDDHGAAALLDAARSAVAELVAGTAGLRPGQHTVSDPRSALPMAASSIDGLSPADGVTADPAPLGRVFAVWGPAGAPGRTTVAAGLAVETASAGIPTVLVDADVYGGVLSSAFGLLDESSGLAGACRQASNGRLDLAELTKLVWVVGPDLRLLTGIARPDRWPEVRPSAVPAVLGVVRAMAPVTIVDCGFCLEADEEITFDTVAPRRNGATLAVLADADVVVAVGSADPPGMERLVRGLAELKESLPQVTPVVVLNRIRRTGPPADEAEAAVSRFASLTVTAELPEDRAGTDKAWQRGQALAEVAPNSPLRKALRQFASTLTTTTNTTSTLTSTTR